jgi:hypothetical protein
MSFLISVTGMAGVPYGYVNPPPAGEMVVLQTNSAQEGLG